MYGLDETSNYPLINAFSTPPWEEPDEPPREYEPADDEMELLRGMLNERGIDWLELSTYGKQRILYPGKHGTVAVISGCNTIGGDVGLLEAWWAGNRHDGWLTAKDVIEDFPPIRRHGGQR